MAPGSGGSLEVELHVHAGTFNAGVGKREAPSVCQWELWTEAKSCHHTTLTMHMVRFDSKVIVWLLRIGSIPID